MKKTFLLLSIISTLGFSQEKFIEVLVKDTITLKPISFDYTVKSDIGFDFEEMNTKKRAELIKKSNKKVLNFLENEKYKFKDNHINTLYASIGGSIPKTYTVFIPDLNSKEKFIEKIEKVDGIEYFLANTYYEQNELTEERIYTKLLEKADKKAELLGKIKNLKIGEIIEISETKASETIFSSFMEKLIAKESALDLTTTFLNDDGVLRKSISVKYKVE